MLEGDTWRERMRHWAVTQRDMLDRHPWVTELPMALPPLAPNSLTFVERGLEALDGTGLSNEQRMRMIGLLSSYTLSEARMAQDAIRAARLAAAERESADGDGAPAGGPSRSCCASWWSTASGSRISTRSRGRSRWRRTGRLARRTSARSSSSGWSASSTRSRS